jgi:thymidylate synthase
MIPYIKALNHILTNGETRADRTGIGTKGIFGYQTRYNLQAGFPAVTTKRLAWKAVVAELLWFLEGSTDERRLAEILYGNRDLSNNTIWTANADNQAMALGHEHNDQTKELGPIYGKQWREWRTDLWEQTKSESTDQISSLIAALQHDPFSRRHIVSAWNVSELPQMSLPPCHVLTQFYVSNDGRLSCQLYQRSVDAGLGLPFNIASYALLTHMMAQITGLKVGDFIHTSGDMHIYLNHIDAIKEQITRKPYKLPTLIMPKFNTLNELLQTNVKDYILDGYEHHPSLKMKMAI